MKISAFIGKGGVGKSTLAVCLSQFLTDHNKTICVGIDQQHNHQDIIVDNHLAIDYTKITNKISDMVKETIENCFMKGFTEYTTLIMPEFVAITELAELTHNIGEVYQEIVIDMPPNTSALDLLNMPNILNNIAFKALTTKNRINKMLKGEDRALDNMEYMTKISDKFRKQMLDANYYVVGITTQLGLLETQRAIAKLEELTYKCKAIIVNMVEPVPDCDSDLLHQRYIQANYYLKEYNEFANKKQIPVIQVQFSFDMDDIYDDLVMGLLDNFPNDF